MAKLSNSKREHKTVVKQTKQGGKKIKTSTMSKTQRRSFKSYRGQGR
jgi:hypothetical protein